MRWMLSAGVSIDTASERSLLISFFRVASLAVVIEVLICSASVSKSMMGAMLMKIEAIVLNGNTIEILITICEILKSLLKSIILLRL